MTGLGTLRLGVLTSGIQLIRSIEVTCQPLCDLKDIDTFPATDRFDLERQRAARDQLLDGLLGLVEDLRQITGVEHHLLFELSTQVLQNQANVHVRKNPLKTHQEVSHSGCSCDKMSA